MTSVLRLKQSSGFRKILLLLGIVSSLAVIPSLIGHADPAGQKDPTGTINISGTITYCAAAVPPGAATTTVNVTGDATTSASTGAAPSTGAYTVANLTPGGAYVLTPTKTGAVSGISSFDAARIQQHVVGPPILTACQVLAGDVSQNGTLSSFDAALIQQFVVNFTPVNPSNHAGEWRFSPTSRVPTPSLVDVTGQDFSAMLLGDVTGNWTPARVTPDPPVVTSLSVSDLSAALESQPRELASRLSNQAPTQTILSPSAPTAASVSLPTASVSTQTGPPPGTSITNFSLPMAGNTNGTPVISFDLHFTYDPAVIGFQSPAVSTTALTSGWSIVVTAAGGTVAISGTAPVGTPLNGSGALLTINFVRVGASGASTSLTWTAASFDEVNATAANGSITIGNAPTEARLSSFKATGYDGGVYLNWQTGFETENLGFNIYREVAGQRTLVTPDLVAGSALMTGAATKLHAGQSYAWWDGGIADCGSQNADCRNAQYWLEEIDLNGTRTMHGPFNVRRIGGTPPRESQAELLSHLGKTDRAVHQLPLTAATRSGSHAAELSIASSSSAAPKLASMPAAKITINEEGWYRVIQQDLAAIGFDSSANPRNLQLFVEGVEQPILVSGEQDGRVDSVEFFATGQDTAATNARVYWLVNGDQQGKRIGRVTSDPKTGGAKNFPYTVERRDRSVYFSSLRNGETENFFGQVIASRALDQSVTLRHVDTTASDLAEVEIALQGVSDLPGDTPDHSVRVLLNGSEIGSLVFDGQAHKAQKLAVKSELLREGDNVVTLTTEGRAGDVSLVDYIHVTYLHTYTSDQDALRMTAGQAQVIDGFTNSNIRVFDISDPSAVVEVAGKVDRRAGGWSVAVDLQGQGVRTLLALTDERIKTPAAITLNQSSKLATKKNKADLLIITRREFFPALEPLAALRESQKLKVAMIDIEDIFDEFSNGEKSPQAVKDFLQFATTTWKKKPRFVMFAGHASLDPRNHLGFGDSDIMPTKLIDTDLMETSSDDWFVDFDNDGLPELAAGRLPFRTASEAATMVSKIISYESSSPASEALLVADVGDTFDFESASGKVKDSMPGSLKLTQINRGRLDPDGAKKAVIDAINRGQKVVNYVGHGSVNLWRGDLLTNDDARSLTNADHLPLFVMMTCLNGYFQDASLDSLGESLLKAERGGAVAVWASSGMTIPEDQALMNQQLYRLLFNQSQPVTLGEAVLRAKASAASGDVRRTWTLLGDPTMRLR